MSFENSRIQVTSSILRIFQLPYATIYDTQEILERNLVKTTTNEYMVAFDTTNKRLRRMMDELVIISGGLDPETAGLIGGYSTPKVRSYFYRENNIRSNAKEYFNATLNDYIQMVNKLEIETGLERIVKLYKEIHNEPVFDNMTIAESISLLQTLQLHIYLDKTLYLAKSIE